MGERAFNCPEEVMEGTSSEDSHEDLFSVGITRRRLLKRKRVLVVHVTL